MSDQHRHDNPRGGQHHRADYHSADLSDRPGHEEHDGHGQHRAVPVLDHLLGRHDLPELHRRCGLRVPDPGPLRLQTFHHHHDLDHGVLTLLRADCRCCGGQHGVVGLDARAVGGRPHHLLCRDCAGLRIHHPRVVEVVVELAHAGQLPGLVLRLVPDVHRPLAADCELAGLGGLRAGQLLEDQRRHQLREAGCRGAVQQLAAGLPALLEHPDQVLLFHCVRSVHHPSPQHCWVRKFKPGIHRA